MNPCKKIEHIMLILADIQSAKPATFAQLQTARKGASHRVAKAQGDIDERTVADKCWRGLWLEKPENFHIEDFDRLVEAWLLRKDGGLRARMERCVGQGTRDADLAAIAQFFGAGLAPIPVPTNRRRGAEIVSHVTGALADDGLHFSHEQVADFYLCLRTKPFVLFAGISGTGKSILARRFADVCGFAGSCQLLPVRPDWTDPGELMGYRNLQGQFVPGHLVEALVAATENSSQPYFLILDEMNLARVEHYLADVLSIMETRERAGDDDSIATKRLLQLSQGDTVAGDPAFAARLGRVLDASPKRELGLPPNLAIVGTVNMDESTHPFSRKVLDRAMTMEFVDIDLKRVNAVRAEHRDPLDAPVTAEDLSANHLSLAEVWEGEGRQARFNPALDLLVEMNVPLSRVGLQVGYRVRDEVCLYLHQNAEERILDSSVALDLALHHKVLPRIRGGDEVEGLLNDLKVIAHKSNLTRCEKKLAEMGRRLRDSGGYTSFWS